MSKRKPHNIRARLPLLALGIHGEITAGLALNGSKLMR